MLTHRITDAGIKLNIVGDCLSVTSNHPLTEEQRQYIRKHKPALLDELRNTVDTVTKKLQQIAQEQNWPLSDLMEWYQKPQDMADIASMEIDALRFVVNDYIENIDLCRGESYQLPSDSPTKLEAVCCYECQHYVSDPLGFGGIGNCAEGIGHTKPLYPKTKRKCAAYKQENNSCYK